MNLGMSIRLKLSLLFTLLFSLCISPVFAQREPLTDEEQAIVEKRWPEAKRTITGVRYVIEREGNGLPARSGDLVTVLYKGMLLNGTVFNEALDPAKPFVFRLGRGLVIDGWDQALKVMNEGSKATLIIPFELAYGTRGNPPAVPKQATLIFEVELLKIERGTQPPAPAPVEPKKKKKWF